MEEKNICRIVKNTVVLPEGIKIPEKEMVLIPNKEKGMTLMTHKSFGEMCDEIDGMIAKEVESTGAAPKLFKQYLRVINSAAMVITIRNRKFSLPMSYYERLGLDDTSELEAVECEEGIKLLKR